MRTALQTTIFSASLLWLCSALCSTATAQPSRAETKEASKPPAPTAIVQNGWLWFGLTPSGNLAAVHCHPTKPQYMRCLMKPASVEDVVAVKQLILKTGVLAAGKSYDTPEEEAAGLAPEDKTELAAQASLVRVALWDKDQHNETSAVGIGNAPEGVRIFAAGLRQICEASPPAEPAAVVFSVDLSRTIGPTEETYADRIEKAGGRFESWDMSQLPEPLQGVCARPETFEVLGTEDAGQTKQLLSGEQTAFVRVDGKPLQIIMLTGQHQIPASTAP